METINLNKVVESDFVDPFALFKDPWEHFDELPAVQQAFLLELAIIGMSILEAAAKLFCPSEQNIVLLSFDAIEESLKTKISELMDSSVRVSSAKLAVEAVFANSNRRLRFGEFEAVRFKDDQDDDPRYAFYRVKDIPKLFGESNGCDQALEAA